MEVRTADDCSWTASAEESWLRISPASGTGPGEVTVSVERNAGDARAGTITVNEETVRVEQEGSRPDGVRLNGTVSNLTGSCPSIAFTVDDRTVYSDASTRFKDNCSEVADGARVKVEGEESADGRVYAIEVDTK